MTKIVKIGTKLIKTMTAKIFGSILPRLDGSKSRLVVTKKWFRRPELSSAGVRLFDCPTDRLLCRFSIIRLPRNFIKRFFFSLSLFSDDDWLYLLLLLKKYHYIQFFVDVIKLFSSSSLLQRCNKLVRLLLSVNYRVI